MISCMRQIGRQNAPKVFAIQMIIIINCGGQKTYNLKDDEDGSFTLNSSS